MRLDDDGIAIRFFPEVVDDVATVESELLRSSFRGTDLDGDGNRA